MTALVVAAHPDDEVLGCGGTIARHIRRGDHIAVAILAQGGTHRAAGKDFHAHIHGHAHAAAVALGVTDLRWYSVGLAPDNRLDTVPLLQMAQYVENWIRWTHPQVVYTHHHGDCNVDHRRVCEAVLAATRPGATSHRVDEVLLFEVPSSTEWSFGQLGSTFRPSVFMDISDTLDLKLAAMACYQTEARAFPHPRSPEALTALARWRGATVGLQAAEAFDVARIVRY